MNAEDVNYWQTSRTSPDTWLEKAKGEIKRAGGTIAGVASISDEIAGKAGYMIAFQLDGDQFKLIWPVLKPKRGSAHAAKIQAATALYHEVKAACVKVKFLGARTAFFAYLLLPDGRVTAEMAVSEMTNVLPQLLLSDGK